MAGESRRIEPWPVAIVLALLALIGVSLTLLTIAVNNPDVELEQGRPGMLTPGEEDDGRG